MAAKIKITLNVEKKIVKYYTSGMIMRLIAGKTGIHPETVRKVLKRLGVKTVRNSKVLPDVQRNIIKLYNGGKSMECIANKYKISTPTVERLLYRNSVPIRNREETRRLNKSPLREDVFDTITEESAYWIGFLMADGCVQKRANKKRGTITFYVCLGLSKIDVSHIKKFKKFVGSKNVIYEFEGGIANTPQCNFRVGSKRIAEALKQYGVVSNKTFCAKVKLLENNRDFWRGMVDGDGCISNAGIYPSISLAGNKHIVEQFRDFVISISPNCSASVVKNKSIWQFTTTGGHAIAVIDKLYDECKISLTRKYRLAKKWLLSDI